VNITVIAVGKLKEAFWKDACAEYLKRLGPYAQIKVHEVADIDPAKAGGVGPARDKEAAAILNAIDSLAQGTQVVLMAIEGKLVSSEDISEALDTWAVSGKSDIAIVIGGSCGVNDAVRQRADLKWSFGRITMPHNMARVVLLEQVYRAFKISRNEPYHK